MFTAYWIAAGLLAFVYLYAGGRKIVQSQEQLAPMMGWVDTVPMSAVRVLGIVEVLGAVGLILPPLTGIAPVLALVAALGFVVLQVLATRLHLVRGEAKVVGFNVFLLLLAAVTAWLASDHRVAG